MKKFETSWVHNHVYYERVYDDIMKKSIKHKINLTNEWYEESSRGEYHFILDENIKLVKHQGKAKDGNGHYGNMNPLYRNIKDNYWNQDKYNLEPRVWYLDIETRVNRGYINKSTSNKKIKIRLVYSKWRKERVLTIVDIQAEFYNGGEENYEYYDEDTQQWAALSTNKFLKRNVGFPQPTKALEEVVLLQIYDNELEVMVVIGSRPWYNETDYKLPFKVQYIQVKDEVELFQTYFKIFKKLNPLIVYAWNGNGFDFPYLYNRMKVLGLDVNELSNYGDVDLKTKIFKGNETHSIKASGHYYIDLLDVYKKYTFGAQASYSLDATAELVLGKKKVNHDEYLKFDDFYLGNYVVPTTPTESQKNSTVYKCAVVGDEVGVKEAAYSDFVYYGIIDAFLVFEIDQAKNFTSLLLMIADKMGVLIDDAMGTVKPWSHYIQNKALLSKQVLPKRQSMEDEIEIKGGYVREPQVGKHSWILSADVNSMYPLLGMVGFNMSPETYVPKYKLPSDLREYVLRYYNDEDEESKIDIPKDVKMNIADLLEKYHYSLGINGAVFSNNKLGMIPEMVQDIYKSRKEAKQTMFKYEKRKLLIKDILDEKMQQV